MTQPDGIVSVVRKVHTKAHTFVPVTDGDVIIGWTFRSSRSGVFVVAHYGWAEAGGSVFGDTYRMRSEAERVLRTVVNDAKKRNTREGENL